MYVIVRKDLSFPQKAVQSAHAAIEAARTFIPSKNHEENIDCLDNHPHLIICEVRDEKKLKSTEKKLKENGIRYRMFIEPDIGDQITAIATEPLSSYDNRREVLRRYQLLQGD